MIQSCSYSQTLDVHVDFIRRQQGTHQATLSLGSSRKCARMLTQCNAVTTVKPVFQVTQPLLGRCPTSTNT